MSCYHPLAGIYKGERTLDGCKKFEINGHYDPIIQEIYPGSVMIPCGKCIGCRLDYSRSWADRMMLELSTEGCAVFLTLTYNNENATFCNFDELGNPISATLVKEEFQRFMKRLRKYFEPKKIRFYACGEYGTKTFRPHYHAIVFGLSLNDFDDLQYKSNNELGDPLYISKKLEKIWSNGFCMVAGVSWKTCAYVSRYCTKKVDASRSILYEKLGKEPEFSLMSRKPGIGKGYLEKHPDCLNYESICISTKEGGVKIGLPKYYLKQIKLTDPERYDIIKKQRKQFAEDAMLLKLHKTNLSFLDMLEGEENAKLKKIKSLSRNVV